MRRFFAPVIAVIAIVALLASCAEEPKVRVDGASAPVADPLREPSGWWVLNRPDLAAEQYLLFEPMADVPPVHAEVFGRSTDLEDLLGSSVLFLKTGVDYPVMPTPGTADLVEITSGTGAGMLYEVGGALVLRWLGATGDSFVLIGRGVDRDDLVAAAASVEEDQGEDVRHAALRQPPEGLTFQFSSPYFGDEAPAARVHVGSNAVYRTPAGSRVTITATGASTDSFTAAALATGADERSLTKLRDVPAVVAPSIGPEPGHAAIWWDDGDLIAVVASGASRDEVIEYASSGTSLAKEQFADLTVEPAVPSGADGPVFEGASSVVTWMFRYDGNGSFSFLATDPRGAESMASMDLPGDTERPPLFGGGLFPVGDGHDFIVGMCDRDVTAVQFELVDGSLVATELRDPDPDLPYRVFGAEVPAGSWRRAIAYVDEREVFSTS